MRWRFTGVGRQTSGSWMRLDVDIEVEGEGGRSYLGVDSEEYEAANDALDASDEPEWQDGPLPAWTERFTQEDDD